DQDRVARHTVDRLSIGDQREWAVPLAGPAVQERKNPGGRMGRNGGGRGPIKKESAHEAITPLVAAGEGEGGGRGAQLLRRSWVAEISQVMPGESRVVVVSKILLDHVPVWHQQLEIPAVPPIPLDHDGIARHPVDRLPVGDKTERSVPSAGPAVHAPEIPMMLLPGFSSAPA